MTENVAEAGATTNEAGDQTIADVTTVDPTAATSTDPKVDEAASKEPEAEVPESYDLKMPEGVELDKAATEEFTAIAKELKLDQATAQKLADVGAKMAQRQVEAHAKLVEGWAESVKTDKEIGGDMLAENLGVARKAIDTFGSESFKSMLNQSGLGNHPEVVKFAYKVGKAISEDGLVTGGAKSAETDTAKKMFPNMN